MFTTTATPITEAVHATLGPSGAHRWMRCPGSVAATKDLPDTTSVYAEEGTAAHMLAEACLTQDKNAEAFLGQEFNGFTVIPEMANHVQDYIDAVRARPGDHWIEVRVDFSDWVPDGFGTSDAVTIDQENHRLYVDDLKFGKGERVNAEFNEQGLLYALGAYSDYAHLYDIEEVVVGIHQPRLNHISEWSCNVDFLLQFADEAQHAALETENPKAPRIPGGKQCRWCRAKDNCLELADHNLELVAAEFNQLSEAYVNPVAVNGITDDELTHLLPQINLMKIWIKALEDRAFSTLEKGGNLPGYKLVEGRSYRRWINEEAAEQNLRRMKVKVGDLFPKKLISVAQAEKLVGRTRFAELAEIVEKPAGKPTLVPASDKRPALEGEAFQDLS